MLQVPPTSNPLFNLNQLNSNDLDTASRQRDEGSSSYETVHSTSEDSVPKKNWIQLRSELYPFSTRKEVIVNTTYMIAFSVLALFMSTAGTVSVLAYNNNNVTTQIPTPQPITLAAVAEAIAPPVTQLPVDMPIAADSAYVLDLLNNKELFSRNASDRLPLASLTKLMLVLTVSEALKPDDPVTITDSSLRGGVEDRLVPGQVWRARDLMDYTLIVSSNTGAAALSQAAEKPMRKLYPKLADSSNPVLDRMNDRARELGLADTVFLNVTGLDLGVSTSGAYGSARDIARLLAYIVTTSPDLLSATAHTSIEIGPRGSSKTRITSAENTNEALPEIPGLIGGKTGYTALAGGNLAVAFDASINRPIIVVVLHSTRTGRFDDVSALVKKIINSQSPKAS